MGSETQFGREAFVLLLFTDFVVLMSIFLSRRIKQNKPRMKRRPSRKTRTAVWLVEKLWSLKGSKIRGLKRRSTSKDIEFVKRLKPSTCEAYDSDVSTSPGSSCASSPMFSRSDSELSPFSRPMSFDLGE